MLAAQDAPGLGGLDLAVEPGQAGLELAEDGLARLPPLDDDAEIVLLARQRIDDVDFLLEPLAALQRALRLGLVAPEFGLGNQLFELGDFVTRAGCLKDNSAARLPAASGSGAAE